jgi:hypothetical protein
MARLKNLILLFILSFSSLLYAQRGGDMPHHEESDKLRSLRVAFLTERLDLSSTEAEKFWPVYNKFHEKTRTLEHQRRKLLMEIRKGELSEEQTENKIQESFSIEEKVIELKREYHSEFKKILSVERVAELYSAEISFQRKVLEELHKRKLRHSRSLEE